MYSDRYARGPKLKLPQGPIILSAALGPVEGRSRLHTNADMNDEAMIHVSELS